MGGGWPNQPSSSHPLYPRVLKTPATYRTDYLTSAQPSAPGIQQPEHDRRTAARRGTSTLEASALRTKTRRFREQSVPVSTEIYLRLMVVSADARRPSPVRSSSLSGSAFGATSRRGLSLFRRFCAFRGILCLGYGGERTLRRLRVVMRSGPGSAWSVLASRTRLQASWARHDVSRYLAFVVVGGAPGWLRSSSSRTIACI